MRRIVCVLLLAVFLSCAVPVKGRAVGDGVTVCRALLVACDFFLSQVSTWPSAAGNVRALADALQADARGYALIRTENGTLNDKNKLEAAIRDTFSGADADDISLLYISTHGLFITTGSGREPALLLSDGSAEDTATAAFLYSAYDGIDGKKVLVLDACQSGAFIGKGMWEADIVSSFTGPAWKVLTSSGGSEKSFYWQSADKSTESLRGGSYFAGVLLDGIGYTGIYAADADGDGAITLQEIFGYLTENHGASTPYCYPQRDKEFVFFSCGPSRDVHGKAVTDFVMDDAVLTAGESEAHLSFTVVRRVRLAYQLVYFREGAWQFANAQIFDTQDSPDGFTRPGRKQKAMKLDTGDADAFGYVLVQLITLEEDAAAMEGARLLCIQPPAGDPGLALHTGAAFSPNNGQELALLINHAFPCSMTVRILDSGGQEVRRVCNRLPSRPQQLPVEGSVLYWDGKTAAGALVPAGWYTAAVEAALGDETFSAVSVPFRLE